MAQVLSNLLTNAGKYSDPGSRVTRAPGGLGLGLAIVRNVVAAHGGFVRAESGGPNQGSEFIIELPAIGLSSTDDAPARGET